MAKANVQNIEALENFEHSIARLRESASKQVDDIREQLQRVSMWLSKELPEYWGNQLRIAQNKWIEARDELARCQAKTRAEDETSCLFQRKALERATARRQICEQRVRVVPQLAMQWEQFLQEISLSVRQVDDMAQSTLPLAEERLKQTISILREYIAQASDPMPPASP
ncbi:MAG: hypothetical protein ACK5OB_14855 [Pirellula sp.]|jgi:hypothetical protein